MSALRQALFSIASDKKSTTPFSGLMTDITLETEAGNLTAYLFKPKNATPENPTPAVLYVNN